MAREREKADQLKEQKKLAVGKGLSSTGIAGVGHAGFFGIGEQGEMIHDSFGDVGIATGADLNNHSWFSEGIKRGWFSKGKGKDAEEPSSGYMSMFHNGDRIGMDANGVHRIKLKNEKERKISAEDFKTCAMIIDRSHPYVGLCPEGTNDARCKITRTKTKPLERTAVSIGSR